MCHTMSPRHYRTILSVPDTHVPFEDRRAWGILLKAGELLQPDILHHAGDLGDFYSISAHSKSPERRDEWSLKAEVDVVNDRLDELDAIGAKRRVITFGNHEHRWERYIRDKAPELFGVTTVEDLYNLPKRGWEWVPYMDSVRIGKVWYTHDVAYVGRYAAHRSMDAFQASVVTGHTHRLSYAVEGNATGKTMLGASFGWLGDFDAIDYTHRVKRLRDWAHGFGFGRMDVRTGLTYYTPVPIVKDKHGDYTAHLEGTIIKG